MALLGWLACAGGCAGTIGDPAEGDTLAPPGTAENDPGTVVVHRLNRTEYRNTLRDLLGTALDPAADFPADDVSLGFDNVSSILTTPPLLFELWEQAATALAEEALRVPSSSQSWQLEAETLTGDNGQATAEGWVLESNGVVGAAVPLPSAGDYQVSARVWGDQAGPDAVQAALVGGGVTLDTFTVAATESAPQILSWSGPLAAGSLLIGVAFLNDYYQPPADRNLHVDWIAVEGPLGVVGTNPIREKIVFCNPGDPACRRDVVAAFAERAWRRPVTGDEIDRLMALVDLALSEGDGADVGLELAVRAILLAPHFLYRPELDDDPTSETPHPLGDFELASRLSYFLWSSMPDEELFQAALAGELQDEAGIAAQVQRMLADPKADALVEHFAGQWLLVRALDDHEPDYATFPSYDEALRDAFRSEMQLFFREFLLGHHGLDELLDAGFTFLNDRLAAHYGASSSGGAALEKAPAAGARRGLLGLGGWLTVTSYPRRTSPVKRGVWILEHFLCDRPPPPPPGVEALPDEGATATSLRERLELHRKDPLCASCHERMDPLGLGLENFDGIGAWRTKDAGKPIDATGELHTADGDRLPFDGPTEMGALLQKDPRFMRCVAQKLLTYALGRGVEASDEPYLDAAVAALAEADHRLPKLIELVALSEPFRMRRGTKEAP